MSTEKGRKNAAAQLVAAAAAYTKACEAASAAGLEFEVTTHEYGRVIVLEYVQYTTDYPTE